MIFYLFLEIVNNRFTTPDFKVYYRAASDLLAGNNMYNHGDAGHYVFKYSPVFALLLIPVGIQNGALVEHDKLVISYALLFSVIISTFAITKNYQIAIVLSRILGLGAKKYDTQSSGSHQVADKKE